MCMGVAKPRSEAARAIEENFTGSYEPRSRRAAVSFNVLGSAASGSEVTILWRFPNGKTWRSGRMGTVGRWSAGSAGWTTLQVPPPGYGDSRRRAGPTGKAVSGRGGGETGRAAPLVAGQCGSAARRAPLVTGGAPPAPRRMRTPPRRCGVPSSLPGHAASGIAGSASGGARPTGRWLRCGATDASPVKVH